jgi:hypothetical protein
MTIVCPNCHHQEPDGAFFCSECGTKLITEDGLSTAAIRSADSSITRADRAPPPPPPIQMSEAVVSLHIVRTGQILPLLGRDEFTIGRVSQGQSILPDVDLTPYEAYSQGVSRLHATININDEEISIKDLGSSNGTRVNNNKIPPHKFHTISHGDVITLGRFKIQALIHQESN